MREAIDGALHWIATGIEVSGVAIIVVGAAIATVTFLRGSELRALRRLRREQVPRSPYLFTTERRGPMTAAGFRKLLARVGQAAGFPFPG